MNKNVLYAAFDVVPNPKGASTHILYNIRGLTGAGYNVHLITPGDGILPPEDELEGARVTRVPPTADGGFLSLAASFNQAVLEQASTSPGYDICHYRAIWGGFALAEAKQRLGYNTLFEVNGLPSIELKYHYPGLAEGDLMTKIREQELATLAWSDVIICPSQVTRAFLASLGVPRGKIQVIPNGYNPRHFEVTTPPSSEESAVSTAPVILYIGTLADWQGLNLLIDSMPEILAGHPAHLRIIGRGRSRQRKALLKQARKLGLDDHISVEPPVPHHEIASVIMRADICIAPLGYNDRNVTQGCCPIKVIEYMGARKPIIAANLPVVRELVREDVDALLFTPEDAHDLARQTLRLLKDPQLADRLANSAAERANRRFTWHASQKRLLDIYASF